MSKEVRKLNEFLGTAFRIINQLDDESVDEKEVVDSFLGELEKLNRRIEDPQLSKYITRLSDRKLYDFWRGEFFFFGVKKVMPIEWYVWDPSEKKFLEYPTRKLIKETLYFRLYTLIGEFLKKAPDGKDIIGQELLDMKNGLSLDYSLDDILEILGDKKLAQKSKEVLKVVEEKKREFEIFSLPLHEISELVKKKVYDVKIREKLGDWIYWRPVSLSLKPIAYRGLLTGILCKIEDLAGEISSLEKVRKRLEANLEKEFRKKKKSKERLAYLRGEVEKIEAMLGKIEEKLENEKELFRASFSELIDHINEELKSNYPKSEWFEDILIEKEKAREELLPKKEVRKIRRPKEKKPRKRKLSEESILEVLESSPLTATEIKEKLADLGFEVDEDTFSNLITSLSAKGKIELTYGPSGIKWKIRTEN